MSDELYQLKIDIALIKKDIKQIERFFTKIDEAVNVMSDITKNLAVQEAVMKGTQEKLDFLDSKIEDHTKVDLEGRLAIKEKLEDARDEFRRELSSITEKTSSQFETKEDEILEKIEELSKTINEKMNTQDRRIRSLENYKWYIMGIGGVVVFLATYLPFLDLFNKG